jgi:hypothetical protein
MAWCSVKKGKHRHKFTFIYLFIYLFICLLRLQYFPCRYCTMYSIVPVTTHEYRWRLDWTLSGAVVFLPPGLCTSNFPIKRWRYIPFFLLIRYPVKTPWAENLSISKQPSKQNRRKESHNSDNRGSSCTTQSAHQFATSLILATFIYVIVY